DQGPFPCAVQCKGFSVQAIGDDQIRQTLDSIEAFRSSGVKVGTYLVVHNRDGKNQKFAQLVEKQMQLLVRNGLAVTSELWDRQKLLSKTDDRLRQLIVAQIRDYSSNLLQEFQSRFKFGRLYKSTVPVTEKTLRFKRLEPCEVSIRKPRARRSARDLIN